MVCLRRQKSSGLFLKLPLKQTDFPDLEHFLLIFSSFPFIPSYSGSPNTSSSIKKAPLFFLYSSALNRLCVELLYEGKKATIEPYSFRKNKEGHILFYGCHYRIKKTDSFKVENIQSVDITDKPFTSKYVVEIG